MTMLWVYEDLTDTNIEQFCKYVEEDGTIVSHWCQGMVVTRKSNNKVIIKWEKKCLEHPIITDKRLINGISMLYGLRVDLGDNCCIYDVFLHMIWLYNVICVLYLPENQIIWMYVWYLML